MSGKSLRTRTLAAELENLREKGGTSRNWGRVRGAAGSIEGMCSRLRGRRCARGASRGLFSYYRRYSHRLEAGTGNAKALTVSGACYEAPFYEAGVPSAVSVVMKDWPTRRQFPQTES